MHKIMKETALLFKINLIHSYNLNRFWKQGITIKNMLLILSGIAVFLFIAPISFSFAFGIAQALKQYDVLYLMLPLTILSASFITFTFSCYKSASFLFDFKDFDLLLSLPLRVQSVMVSKIILLYGSNSMIMLLLNIPMIIAYCVVAGAGPLTYVVTLILFMFVPLIPMLLGSCLTLMWIRVAQKFKYKKIISLVGYFIFSVALLTVNFWSRSIIPEDLTKTVPALTRIIQVYLPAKWMGDFLMYGNVGALISFLSLSIVSLLLFVWLFSNSFHRLNSVMGEHTGGSNTQALKTSKVRMPITSLYRKELNYLFSSHIYVMNTGMGLILLTLFIGSLFFIGPKALQQVLDLSFDFSPVLFQVCFIVSSLCLTLSCTTSSSISLEGKTIWQVKSLPLHFQDIALSKILVNLTLTVPFIVMNGVVIGIVSNIGLLATIFTMLSLMIFSAVVSSVGLITNLWFPKLVWKSHVQVVKQSGSSFWASVLNLILAIIFVALTIIQMLRFNILIGTITSSAVFGILLLLLFYYLKKKGAVLFHQLS